MTDPATIADAIKQVDVTACDLTTAQRVARGTVLAEIIAPGGDAIMWPNPKFDRAQRKDDRPTTTDIASAIAEGIAILAHRPGGIDFAGRHWCAEPHGGCEPGELWDTPSGDQGGTGAFYTPMSLANQVTEGALEPLVYEPGPLQTGDKTIWRLKPSADIAALKTADIAVGSGVFLLSSVNYLAGKLTEAWAHESGDTQPVTPAQRLHAATLALRCVHGADINAWAIELCHLALSLLAPTAVTDVRQRLKVRDSLIGITNWESIRYLASHNRKEEFEGLTPVFTGAEMYQIYAAWKLDTDQSWMAHTLADLAVAAGMVQAGIKSKLGKAQIRTHAVELARKLCAQPDERARVETQTREWLYSGRPENAEKIPPLHWCLEFPGVFPIGKE
jgi:hypothetical protein